MIIITSNEPIAKEKLSQINDILENGKKIPNTLPEQDGKWFTHKHEFTTRKVKELIRKFEQFKKDNTDVKIDLEHKKTFEIPFLISAKNLIFPVHATIRYTLDQDTDPDNFKKYLDSSLKSEELSEAEFIGNKKFQRFKIRFKVNDKEQFDHDFTTFKNNRKNIDIYEEYEKTSIKTYTNFALLAAAIILWAFRAEEIINHAVEWFKEK